MLEVHDLHAYYGKSHILQGVDFRVAEGEIVSLLGRNGVGRSTTIKAIMGDVNRTGSVKFKGREIGALKPHQVARCGLGYVPENRDIFPQLTVRENLLLGMKSLFAVVESYPQLKSDANFRALQEELAVTEDRIAAARRFFNNAVGEYNTAREQFPAVIFAGMFGFGPREFFDVGEDSRASMDAAPPQVKFN